MKIVQIYPGKVWGGAEQFVTDLGRELTARGHDVRYMCEDSAAVTSRLDREAIGYATIRHGGWPMHSPDIGWLARQVADADVVHIHDSRYVGPLTRAIDASGGRARLVLTRHIARRSSVSRWRRKDYLRLGAMTFVSDLARRLWCPANGWMPQQLCRTVLNSIPPVNEDTAPQEGLRRLYGIAPDTPLLVFTGRVRKSKGCELIIDALGNLPPSMDWAMVFIGVGKPAGYPDRLKALAHKLGIGAKVHFYGHSDSTRILIRDSDIGVQPSIVRESFGLSPLEFMQAGKAVVTTDNGGQREFIRSGINGLLIAPDAGELTEALRKLITDRSCRERLGTEGRRTYEERMSYTRFVDRMLNIYEEVTDRDDES